MILLREHDFINRGIGMYGGDCHFKMLFSLFDVGNRSELVRGHQTLKFTGISHSLLVILDCFQLHI